MTMLREIAAGLLGMFLADFRLTIEILLLVAIVAALIAVLGVAPLWGGGLLLAGSLLIIVASVLREARLRGQR